MYFQKANGQDKILNCLERGTVVGARRTGLSVSRTATQLGFSTLNSFSCVSTIGGATQYQEGVPNVLYTHCTHLQKHPHSYNHSDDVAGFNCSILFTLLLLPAPSVSAPPHPVQADNRGSVERGERENMKGGD